MLNGFRKFILILGSTLFCGTIGLGQKTLDDYIHAGFSNNPVLKDLDNQVKDNSTDSLISHAGFQPQISLNGYMMYAPVVDGYGYSNVITNGQNLTGTLNVSQDIFNKKTRDAEYEKFGIRNKSLQNDRQISRNELQKEITAQYLNACSAYLETLFNKEMLETLQEEEKILQQLVEAGSFRQTDYLSFRLAMGTVDRQLKDLRIRYRNELFSLNILCGLPDTTEYGLELPVLEEVRHPENGKSPLFQRFALDSLKIENEKTILDRKYKPTLSWFSDAGLVNNLPKYIYQNFGLSIGMSLNLPVYDGNQRKLNFSKLKTSEETRKNYESYFRLQYDLQIRQLNADLEKTRQIITDTEDQIKLASTLTEQNKILLNAGSISVTDYILSLKNLLEAKQVLTHYQVHALQIVNELNYWKQ